MTLPAHSPLGPSSAERWLNCPGSVLATKDLPDTESEYSAEGTAAHQLAEGCQKTDRPAKHFLGKKISVGEFTFTVDQEMVDGVQAYLDYVNDLPGESFSEVRLHFNEWVPDGFGTGDDIRIDGEDCYVTDLKYGKGVQKWAKDNPQMMLYALGVLHDYSWLYPNIKRFHLAIVQPRLDHIDEWKIHTVNLVDWAEKVVRPAAELALAPGAPFKAGEWCQFCKIKSTCKARAESVFAAVVGDFEDLDAAASTATTQYSSPAVLTNDQIAKLLEALPNVKRWTKDLERHARQEVMHGHPVGDFKLVAGRASREWEGDLEEVAEALSAEGVPDDKLWERELISPAAAEKIIGKKNALLVSKVKKVAGKPTLVPGSDKRPALVIDPTTEFKDLDEDDE